VAGPLIGGGLAAAVYRVQQPSERTPQEALELATAAAQPIAR